MFQILPERVCIRFVAQVQGNSTIIIILCKSLSRKAEFWLQIVLKNSPFKNIIFFEEEFICCKNMEQRVKIIEKMLLGRSSEN